MTTQIVHTSRNRRLLPKGRHGRKARVQSRTYRLRRLARQHWDVHTAEWRPNRATPRTLGHHGERAA